MAVADSDLAAEQYKNYGFRSGKPRVMTHIKNTGTGGDVGGRGGGVT